MASAETLTSMTGFGRADGAAAGLSWVIEVRSVNGRGLDLRLRVPPGFDALEPAIRERVQKSLTRGSVAVNLTVKRIDGGNELRINRDAIARIAEAVALMRAAIPGPSQVNIDGLLALRGVLDDAQDEETELKTAARTAAVLVTLERALQNLVANRRSEGGRLALVLTAQLDEIAALIERIAASPSRSADAIRTRLADQVARLLGAGPAGAGPAGAALDPARLHQEAMLIATRIDVEEELARLRAHVAAAHDLLRARDPIGRKFDFLTQEFNREANTLCSKANDVDITRAGLAMKAVIDQMREQVQNIE